MQEISPDELYDSMIQYGLFSEKLPPVFDATSFMVFCKDPMRTAFSDKWYAYADYDSMRNINIPRPIGIPTPMGYERLCSCLKEHWEKLQEHFQKTTAKQKHIISRIHIRKMRDTDALFQMNYKNWRTDGTPEPDIALGKRFMVAADISKCFPSIYTHALSWALVGKEIAKQNAKKQNEWYNQIDHWAQQSKNGETHGVLIGPHTSNILAEIILCKIDEELCEKWEYVRNIDDYCCYVYNRENADDFLIDLNRCLKKYGLSLNHKKTEIFELPVGMVEKWVHQIQSQSLYFEKFQPYVNYHEVQAFLDFSIELMSKNRDNASIILYALKTIQGHRLTRAAQQYLSKNVVSLSLIYPYVVPLLDRLIFVPCSVATVEIEKYVNLIYEHYLPKNHFEACTYALYYATKYSVKIHSFNSTDITEKNDCILSLMALIYCRKRKDTIALKSLKVYAKQIIADGELEEQWPFVYECLTVGLLTDDWKKMKQAKVSFLKAEYR